MNASICENIGVSYDAICKFTKPSNHFVLDENSFRFLINVDNVNDCGFLVGYYWCLVETKGRDGLWVLFWPSAALAPLFELFTAALQVE